MAVRISGNWSLVHCNSIVRTKASLCPKVGDLVLVSSVELLLGDSTAEMHPGSLIHAIEGFNTNKQANKEFFLVQIMY